LGEERYLFPTGPATGHREEKIPLFSKLVHNPEILPERKEWDICNTWAVYNPNFVGSFAFNYINMRQRAATENKEFWNQEWIEQYKDDHKQLKQRDRVLKFLREKENKFSWNKKAEWVKILPVFYATSLEDAWKICDSGFTANSSQLNHWYGSGIYFTTNANYATEYLREKGNVTSPALVLCFLIGGNAFPVTEALYNSALKDGYQSHYVLTTSTGKPELKPHRVNYFDEIVINQSAQVCPAFVFEIKL